MVRKVIVTGGRDYANVDIVNATLTALAPDRLFVGDASGADALALAWAKRKGVPYVVFKADWDAHGKAAGPIRNAEMISFAGQLTLVVAFPGGAGTANCMKTAREKGNVVVRVVE